MLFILLDAWCAWENERNCEAGLKFVFFRNIRYNDGLHHGGRFCLLRWNWKRLGCNFKLTHDDNNVVFINLCAGVCYCLYVSWKLCSDMQHRTRAELFNLLSNLDRIIFLSVFARKPLKVSLNYLLNPCNTFLSPRLFSAAIAQRDSNISLLCCFSLPAARRKYVIYYARDGIIKMYILHISIFMRGLDAIILKTKAYLIIIMKVFHLNLILAPLDWDPTPVITNGNKSFRLFKLRKRTRECRE